MTDDRIAPLALPSALIGIALAGLVDAIALHQILHWHHALSILLPMLAGVVLMFAVARRDDVVWAVRIFAGAVLFGAGAFAVVEGLIAHVLLGLHHVRPGAQLAWDLGFVTIGAALMVAGFLLGRSEISRGHMSPATRRALAL